MPALASNNRDCSLALEDSADKDLYIEEEPLSAVVSLKKAVSTSIKAQRAFPCCKAKCSAVIGLADGRRIHSTVVKRKCLNNIETEHCQVTEKSVWGLLQYQKCRVFTWCCIQQG